MEILLTEIKDNKISLEVNRVYVFKMEFKYGTCEYVLSTYIDTLEKLPIDFKSIHFTCSISLDCIVISLISTLLLIK